MAWHHRACWRGHGRCSSCQAEAVLERVCAAAPCAEPLNEVVTKPTRIKTYGGGVDLQQLCAAHAAQSVDQQLNLLWVSFFVMVACALGGGLFGIGLFGSGKTQELTGAWTLCLAGFLLAPVPGYYLVSLSSLQARLRGRSERPSPGHAPASGRHKPLRHKRIAN
jgi:hypothetical protein